MVTAVVVWLVICGFASLAAGVAITGSWVLSRRYPRTGMTLHLGVLAWAMFGGPPDVLGWFLPDTGLNNPTQGCPPAARAARAEG